MSRIGKQTLVFDNSPVIRASAAVVGKKEGEGPLGKSFDLVLEDDTWGEKSWEIAERKMFKRAVELATEKCGIELTDVECLLGGDLLNQLISANYAARTLKMPFLGLYGACSTMSESMLIGAMMVDGGYASNVACAASSHFSTAERQFRLPLEMGTQLTPTAQRTVTGAGSVIIGRGGSFMGSEQLPEVEIHVTSATIGAVSDFGIKDGNNLGAAMAPAAADTIATHLADTGRSTDYYDLIITGDLGSLGSELLLELCREERIRIEEKHIDCGCTVFFKSQNVACGGSGCGCSASVLSAYLLKRMAAGDFKRALFMATGALMSPTSSMQGDSIPGIAHAVALERVEK